jgi:hypothetical protein
MSPRQLSQNTACGGGRLVTLITPRLVGICQPYGHKAQVALAAAAIEALPVRSFVVDGQVVLEISGPNLETESPLACRPHL